MQGRLASYSRPPLPVSVLEETKISLDLLFPIRDDAAVALLGEEEQRSHEQGPFEVTPTLILWLAVFGPPILVNGPPALGEWIRHTEAFPGTTLKDLPTYISCQRSILPYK